MSGAILRPAVLLALTVTTGATGRLAAQASEDECSIRLNRTANLHLNPGQSASGYATIMVLTPAGMRAPRYEWRVMPSRLGSATPESGAFQFNESGPGLTRGSRISVGDVVFDFAAQRRGAEAVVVRVSAADPSDVPHSCRAIEARVPVSVGGTWRIQADTLIEGDMSIRGSWLGVFDVVDGGRIDGVGIITTTVTGSCVSGWKSDPMKISGHLADDILHITIVGEPDDQEPETVVDPDMRCVIRTLRELPSFMQGIGTLVGMMASNEPCPLRVPAADEDIEVHCAGVLFRLRRTQ